VSEGVWIVHSFGTLDDYVVGKNDEIVAFVLHHSGEITDACRFEIGELKPIFHFRLPSDRTAASNVGRASADFQRLSFRQLVLASNSYVLKIFYLSCVDSRIRNGVTHSRATLAETAAQGPMRSRKIWKKAQSSLKNPWFGAGEALELTKLDNAAAISLISAPRPQD
jgi:hypothetical protein